MSLHDLSVDRPPPPPKARPPSPSLTTVASAATLSEGASSESSSQKSRSSSTVCPHPGPSLLPINSTVRVTFEVVSYTARITGADYSVADGATCLFEYTLVTIDESPRFLRAPPSALRIIDRFASS